LMLDQAHDLRQLATRCKPAETPRRSARPALVVVAGGKGGVGTTTVALELAAAVSKAGRRTLLIDADSRGGDVALLCGIEERYTLADVMAGRRSWNEAVCAGPAGVRVVVGERDWHDDRNPAAAAGHFLDQFEHQDTAAEVALIDVGNRLDAVTSYVCRRADAVVMVTTGGVASVVGAFAAIKSLLASCNGNGRPSLQLLVNMTSSARVAEIVYYRLARTCRRVLGVDLRYAGRLGMAECAGRKSWGSVIGLNLQVTLADIIRGVSAVEVLSNWKRRVKFNGNGLVAQASRLLGQPGWLHHN
jgi:flagellar biosynthesis protein FlhG